ncbi:SRPBCC family protein [Pseudonocardia hispaniensis]|uniref:SRPBCC family protein n=1 Tax=Pseudonocardia hispaniensis TaxID=904933 RepID=A0ABW1J954_9PSEU
MPRPYASAVIPASADQVWELVRDFDGLPGWHPAIASSELTSGAAAEVGAIRKLTLGDGAVVVERLVILDDADRRYTYEFVENPFDVRRYVSTIRVAPVTDTGQAFVEWWSEYDADGAAEAQLTELFAGNVYAAGLTALQKRFTT